MSLDEFYIKDKIFKLKVELDGISKSVTDKNEPLILHDYLVLREENILKELRSLEKILKLIIENGEQRELQAY